MSQILPEPESVIIEHDDCVTVRRCGSCGLDFTTTDNYQARDKDAHRCDSATAKAYAALIRLKRFAALSEGKKQASLAQWARARTVARPINADVFIEQIAELEPMTPISMFFMRYVIEYFEQVNLTRFNRR